MLITQALAKPIFEGGASFHALTSLPRQTQGNIGCSEPSEPTFSKHTRVNSKVRNDAFHSLPKTKQCSIKRNIHWHLQNKMTINDLHCLIPASHGATNVVVDLFVPITTFDRLCQLHVTHQNMREAMWLHTGKTFQLANQCKLEWIFFSFHHILCVLLAARTDGNAIALQVLTWNSSMSPRWSHVNVPNPSCNDIPFSPHHDNKHRNRNLKLIFPTQPVFCQTHRKTWFGVHFPDCYLELTN